MSKRGRSTTSRRAKKSPLLLNEDMHTCGFSLLMARATRSRKRSTPQKKNVAKTALPRVIPKPPLPPAEVITLDDTAECIDMTNNVESKVKTFIESGSFFSSDEEDEANSESKEIGGSLSVLSNDNNLKKWCKSTLNDCEASTSSAICSSGSKLNGLEDDLMEIVDSVLDQNSGAPDNKLTDMKSLEDFRKETEEMLQNASKLLDEIKTGRATEPEKKVEPPAEEDSTKSVASSCPICLESLCDRAASVTICGHIFCTECLKQAAKTLKKCPTCRKQINAKKIHPIYL